MSEEWTELCAFVKDRLNETYEDSKESHKQAMNSYGAGYDAGAHEAFKEVYGFIMGDDDE